MGSRQTPQTRVSSNGRGAANTKYTRLAISEVQRSHIPAHHSETQREDLHRQQESYFVLPGSCGSRQPVLDAIRYLWLVQAETASDSEVDSLNFGNESSGSGTLDVLSDTGSQGKLSTDSSSDDRKVLGDTEGQDDSPLPDNDAKDSKVLGNGK